MERLKKSAAKFNIFTILSGKKQNGAEVNRHCTRRKKMSQLERPDVKANHHSHSGSICIPAVFSLDDSAHIQCAIFTSSPFSSAFIVFQLMGSDNFHFC